MSHPADDLEEDLKQYSDYDGAWKEAFRFHLRSFFERFFPKLAVFIDWTCEPNWLDKELSQIVGQAGRRNREVDLLFSLRLIDGRDQWVFCHLEIQTSYEADFAFRIDLYGSGLKWMFRREVLTLVVLADLNPNWRPSEHRFDLGGYGNERRFAVCKVIDHLKNDWAGDLSLPVQVARAQIAAIETASDPEARYSAKTQLVRNLYSAGYTADELREAFRLIDWMMHLRLDLSQRFDAELLAYEREKQMPYVTSVERNAEQRGLEKGREAGREAGREEGREEGSAAILIRILTRVCGRIPPEVESQIRQLSIEQREVLGESLLDFHTLTDLLDWLKAAHS